LLEASLSSLTHQECLKYLDSLAQAETGIAPPVHSTAAGELANEQRPLIIMSQ
jgi:hypothetical protein